MPSSISSSESSDFERTIPPGAWLSSIAVALFLGVAAVAAMEYWLAVRGFRPTVSDSPALWISQRMRASELGEKAITLVGASRVQLDLDMRKLRDATGLEPVQLAVDGSSFLPILEDLSLDPSITGTVLVGYQDNVLVAPRPDHASAMVREWRATRTDHGIGRWNWPTFDRSEGYIDDVLKGHLRSYADGANPVSTLMLRLLDPRATPQYLVMRPSRARSADYRLVDMPAFYYRRVLRNLGKNAPPVEGGMSWEALDRALKDTIGKLPPSEAGAFAESARKVAEMAAAIEARGGKVYFVVFPTSGLVKALDDHLYPRALFWDTFVSNARVTALHFEDSPALRSFHCPDGSHLDYRDQIGFTDALVTALGLGRGDR